MEKVEESFADYCVKADQEYKQRTKHIVRSRRKHKQKKRKLCFWPNCTDPVQTSGMCSKHRGRYYAGTLIPLDHTAFIFDEMISLYRDILKYAESMEITPGAAAVWLLAEGLNAYDAKEKGKK